MAFMVRGLLMLSVETSEVSIAPRPVGVDQLVHEVAGPRVVDEQPVDPHVLRADQRAEVGVGGMGRIGRRVHRAGAHVAEAAGHADPVGPHQLGVVVVFGVGIVALRVPVFRGLGVEIGVGEEPQADHAAGVAEIGADRHRLAPRPDRHARILLSFSKGSGGQLASRRVEPQAVALGIGPRGLGETGLVDQAQPAPARIPIELLARMGGDDLQEVEGAEGVGGHPVPEAVVAAGPHQPHVAALDLVRGQGDGAVHVVEIVLGRLGEGRGVRPPRGGRRGAGRGGAPPPPRGAGDQRHADRATERP